EPIRFLTFGPGEATQSDRSARGRVEATFGADRRSWEQASLSSVGNCSIEAAYAIGVQRRVATTGAGQYAAATIRVGRILAVDERLQAAAVTHGHPAVTAEHQRVGIGGSRVDLDATLIDVQHRQLAHGSADHHPLAVAHQANPRR